MAVLTRPRCEVCGRSLTSAESMAAGIGPECRDRRAGFYGGAGISVEAVDALAVNPDPDVRRWLGSMRSALRHGDLFFARRFWLRAQIAAGLPVALTEGAIV